MYAGRSLGYYPRSSTGKISLGSIFTVEDKQDKMMLKEILEKKFRPIFQQFVYGGEQMAIHDLRRLLDDDNYRRYIPEDRLYVLMDLVTFNPTTSMSYETFFNIVLNEGDDSSSLATSIGSDAHHYTQKPGGGGSGNGSEQNWLNVVVTNIAPQKEIDDFLPKYRFCPPPFFMITITLVQIIMYVVAVAQLNGEGVPRFSPLIYLPTKRHEVWRFFTYMFYHQGYIDLLFNVIIQVVVGFPLEVVFSWWRLFIVYICGVITGSLIQSVTDHYVGLVGASGGAYAILTAHVMAMIYNWSELNNDPNQSKCRRRACNVPLRVIVIILVVAVQVGLGVYRRFLRPDYVKFGIAAYGGGVLAGFLLGKPFMKDRRRYPWQQNAGWLDLFIFIAFVGGCVIFNIVFRGYPATIY
ncbi:rhomboid-related protein 2-like [Gigantopelta aegis]|uniref:rhomboid-related protein 2-like n=1 Tax=Gigantopelta aegis TaxID=1735272 RepID=UPI001B88C8AC|nr:rhomboid-related protein 2-like [Gigantopelta aegis]XP_041369365.1 rhomboid-related protein 2-like [Gigantopelta aegis]